MAAKEVLVITNKVEVVVVIYDSCSGKEGDNNGGDGERTHVCSRGESGDGGIDDSGGNDNKRGGVGSGRKMGKGDEEDRTFV